MRRRIAAAVAVAAGVAAPALVAAPAHAYEVHISITGAGQITELTQAGLVGTGCVTSSNNPTGTIGADCYPGDPAGDYGWGWTVQLKATSKPGYRFVRWQSDGGPKPVVCDGANGSSTYTGETCTFQTFDNLQTRAVFEDVTAPAMSSLSGPNAPVSGATSFTFAAAADPTLSGFECRVANVHDWTSCASGRSEDPPSSGTYAFEVRAVDTSGNRSAISTWQWTVDKVAPTTTLVNGASGPFASTSAVFAFTSNEAGTFRCSLDGGAFAVCASPASYVGLAQGQHTFAVAAVDVAGNVDATPAVSTWTVDTLPPETTLTSGPEGTNDSTSASFTFTSEPGALFSCRLDGGIINTSCTSPATYDGLSSGEHVFRVWARDALGNSDASPALRTWTVVDSTPPETTLTSGPSASTESTWATFTFASELASTFRCQLDGAAPGPCTSPVSYTGISPGQHTFTVWARDTAGNEDATPATHTWTVLAPAPQPTPPVTVPDTPPRVPDTIIKKGPGLRTTDRTPTFSFTTTVPGSTYLCKVDRGGYRPCRARHTLRRLSLGKHTLLVKASYAGRTDPTPAKRRFKVVREH